jgi:hypothetical protein
VRSGVFVFGAGALAVTLAASPPSSWAADRATDALDLRLRAEREIGKEAAGGNRELAAAMRELLPGLLKEHVLTQDESVAIDTVDAGLVQEELRVEQAMAEPGLAWALEVFVGPGTSHEQGVRDAVRDLARFHRGPGMSLTAVAATFDVGNTDRPMERRLNGLLNAYEHYLEAHDADFEARLNAALDRTNRGLERAAARGLNAAAGPGELPSQASERVQEAPGSPPASPPAEPPAPEPPGPGPADPGPPGGTPPGQGGNPGNGQGNGRGP